MSSNGPRRQLARATSLFARSVYSELQRAGYARDDILRFVNELMELLSSGGERLEPPRLLDPEGGLPDRDTIVEILAFEMRRTGGDRRRGLVVATIDVALPSWAPTAARKVAHELVAAEIGPRMRATDALGRLGPDRYLLILPDAGAHSFAVVSGRIEELLDARADELPDSVHFELRSVEHDASIASAAALVERCLARPALGLPRRSVPPPSASPGVPAQRARTQLTLALGGGAARAASHAGVLAAVAAEGMDVVGIAGCSAGGIVGAMFARGTSPAAIERRFSGFASTATYREMRRAYARFVLRGRRNRQAFRRHFRRESALALHSEVDLFAVEQELFEAFVSYFVGPDCDMASLPIPFALVATDLVEGIPVILSHGSLHAAVAASCAVPGLFPPQRIGERLLVDGSSVNEVPIGAAHALGLRAPVLGVHLSRPLGRGDEFTTSAELVTRMNALVHAELLREQLAGAGLLVSVPVGGVGWLDFRQARELARLGEEAARDVLARVAPVTV